MIILDLHSEQCTKGINMKVIHKLLKRCVLIHVTLLLSKIEYGALGECEATSGNTGPTLPACAISG